MHSIRLYRFLRPGFELTGNLPGERLLVDLIALFPLLDDVRLKRF
jgi:hypothetical protein